MDVLIKFRDGIEETRHMPWLTPDSEYIVVDRHRTNSPTPCIRAGRSLGGMPIYYEDQSLSVVGARVAQTMGRAILNSLLGMALVGATACTRGAVPGSTEVPTGPTGQIVRVEAPEAICFAVSGYREYALSCIPKPAGAVAIGGTRDTK